MTVACLDVHYAGSEGCVACLVLESWFAAEAERQIATIVRNVLPYEPGSFFKRELPCLMKVLPRLAPSPEVVVIDGYVWLGEGRMGLGAHLYEALERSIPIVGVAKTEFLGAEPIAMVLRGSSQKPLFVSAVGTGLSVAAEHVKKMHGRFRIPWALTVVDQMARSFQPRDEFS
jgi:deoxyribonuclease V